MKSGLYRRTYLLYIVYYMAKAPSGGPLGEFEQLVLLALLRLGNGAFGAAIHREIVARTGRNISAGAVYVTLERLEGKRMVCSYLGATTPQRGGRRRKHYLLDTAGQRALWRAYRTFLSMIGGMQQEFEALAQSVAPSGTAVPPGYSRTRW
jgi:DNA-binding PadR family transcriptional regulator